MKDLDLTNKVSIITGGGSGIGQQIAYTFADYGSNIVIIDINEKAGVNVISKIEKKYKRKALFIPCDITDYKKVSLASGKIIEHFKKVDNIICAAGYCSRAALEEMSISEWKKAVDVNLNGAFYIIRCLIPYMLKQKKGNIIVIGSATVQTGSGGGVHYAATKTAQYGVVRGLAYEFLSRGIRANIITPHIIDTPMLRLRYPDNLENNKILAGRIPIGRIGKPADIANIALFLASDESGYICGAEILADGGAVHYKH